MTVMKKSEYADSRGWSRAYVSKLAKNGRLVLTANGKEVEAEASDRLLAETADPSKAGVAERHQQERVEKHVGDLVKPAAPVTQAAPPAAPGEGGTTADGHNFQNARAKREHFLAALAENEYRLSQGELAVVEDIRRAGYSTARMLRDLLLGMPRQIAAELAAINDPWEAERRLTDELRRVLADAERVSAADLEKAIKPKN